MSPKAGASLMHGDKIIIINSINKGAFFVTYLGEK